MPELLLIEPAGQPARAQRAAWRCASRSLTARGAACRGESPSAAIQRPRPAASTTSTDRSACPSLGLSATPEDELVVAPYASVLAAMLRPALGGRATSSAWRPRRARQLRLLRSRSIRARRGCPRAQRFAWSRAYMAHHQAMTLLAIANLAHDGADAGPLPRPPAVRAAELLLQERTPRDVLVVAAAAGRALRGAGARIDAAGPARGSTRRTPRRRAPTCSPTAATRLLLTQAGGGWSRRGDIAVTRFREDPTRDEWGSFLYLREPRTGEVWSAALSADAPRARLVRGGLRPRRRSRSAAATAAIDVSCLEVVVSPEDDARAAALTLTNPAPRPRKIEVTSYAEIGAGAAGRRRGPPGVLQAVRRDRVRAGPAALLAAAPPARADGAERCGRRTSWRSTARADGARQHETDRARFLGRGRTPARPGRVARRPAALRHHGHGARPVLQPAASACCSPPGASARLVFTTLVGDSRAEAVRSPTSTPTPAAFQRAAALAWTHAQVELRHLGIDARRGAPLPAPGVAPRFPRALPDDAAPRPLRRNRAAASRRSGRSASRATCRSCLLRIDDEEDRGHRAPAGARPRLLAARAAWRSTW